MVTCIYKITSPSGKVYIGQTIDIFRRFNEYRINKCKSQKRLYNSLIKYSFSHHSFDVLDFCDSSIANDIERHYQDKYNAVGANGLNCKLSQSKDRKGRLSDEVKAKIGKSNIGKHNHSDRVKSLISKAHKGKTISKEHIQSMSAKLSIKHSGRNNPFYNKTHSEEYKKILSLQNKNENNPNSKIILDTYTGVYYYTLKELACFNKISPEYMRYKIKKTKTKYIYA